MSLRFIWDVKRWPRELECAYETHGQDGMGDIGLVPKRLKAAEGNGVIKLIEALRNSEPGEIDIVALGPLTNLAIAIGGIMKL